MTDQRETPAGGVDYGGGVELPEHQAHGTAPKAVDIIPQDGAPEKRFAALFAGGDHAHGVSVPTGETSSGGKAEAKYETRRRPIPEEAWRQHLDGKEGLVPIPIRRDGTVSFGAIDIDVYPLDLKKLVEHVQAAELPLVVCRTKSGGAHLFLFLTEPAPAGPVRAKLTDWCGALGYRPKEIFPKQDELEGDNPGSGINLPYFHSEFTTRYAVGPEGEGLSLDEFLDAAESARVTATELETADPTQRFSVAVEGGVVKVLADCYPGHGDRQDYVGAVVGTLTRWGVDEATTRDLIERLVRQASDDEPRMRLAQVARVRRSIDKGHKAPGGPKLRKFIGGENFSLLRRTFRGDEPAELDDMNAEYAVAWAGPDVVILREHFDATTGRDTVTFVKDNAPKKYLANRFVPVGNRQVPLYDWWFSHPARRQYRQVVFEPESATPEDYNLWRGWAVEPDPRGRDGCRLFLEHLHDVICDGNTWHYEWLLAWLAQAVQQPGGRPGTAVVQNAGEGAGKGLWVQYYACIWGEHFLHLADKSRLIGHFNAHLKNALLVYGDEAFYGGDKQSSGVLKAIITEKLIAIEPKFKDVLQVRNHMRLVMSSNESWSVPAGFDARRFFMPVISEHRKGDGAYFDALAAEMENGGPACLLHYLKSVTPEWIAWLDVRRAPKTSVLMEQKERTMDPTDRFWYERLMEGELLSDVSDANVVPSDDGSTEWANGGIWVRKRALHDACLEHCKRINERYPPSDTAFWTRLRKICPGAITADKKKQFCVAQDNVEGHEWLWAAYLPSLDDCRRVFSNVTRQEIRWPRDEDDEARRQKRTEELKMWSDE